MTFESENIEYKREYVDGICKEVVAFANTNGGRILVLMTTEILSDLKISMILTLV